MKAFLVFFVATGLALAAPAYAAEKSDKDREELRKEMADARHDLAEAARRVAELSADLGMDTGRDFAVRFFSPDAPRRAMLGIAIEHRRHNDGQGVDVLSVTPGGPADKAGIQAGDIIMNVGETNLAETESPSRALIDALADVEPGSTLAVTYRRGEDERSVDVTVEEFHSRNQVFAALGELPELPVPRRAMFLELMRGWGEMELAPVSRRLGEYFGAESGLLVVRAPADEAFKLQDGDVILAIDGREPEDAAHAMRILRSYRGGETLTLDILRKKKKQTLEIEVPERRSSEYRGVHGERKVLAATPAAN